LREQPFSLPNNQSKRWVAHTLINYFLHISSYYLSLTHYFLFITFYQLLTYIQDIPMTDFIRPEFTPDFLTTYLGYHLQFFRSGRAKISFQITPHKKVEFYADCPKRDRQGLLRQKKRSGAAIPQHFDLIATLLSTAPDAKVFRLHAKGDNNATADNAHLLVSLDQAALWLVMSEVTHQWELTPLLAQVLLEGKGKRLGEASIFNEYMPTYEHDWQDAEFGLEDYTVGSRLLGDAPVLSAVAAPPPAPRLVQNASVRPIIVQHDCVSDDPDDDPIFFTDPTCEDAEDVPFASPPAKVPQRILTNGTSTLYDKGVLWAEVQGSR
jgi:hypothetical protein